MGEVKVSAASVLREWRRADGEQILLGFVTNDGWELVDAVLSAAAARVSEELQDRLGVVDPVPYGKGALLFVDYCYDQAAVERMLEIFGDAAREGGLSGTFRPATVEPSPYWQLAAREFEATHHEFVAAASLRGQALAKRGDWRVDPALLDAVRAWAFDWCQVPGGSTWIGLNGVSFPIASAAVPEIINRVPQGRRVRISAADVVRDTPRSGVRGMRLARQVTFDPWGRLLMSIAFNDSLDWRGAVEELSDNLRGLSRYLDYGVIRRGGDRPMSMGSVLAQPWLEHVGTVEARAVSVGRHDEAQRVASALGIQVLGPGHQPWPDDRRWQVEDLGDGMAMFTDTDAEAWFAQPPSFDLLVSARRSFAPMLSRPEWQPTRI